MNKSFAVIGMGRFGRCVAMELYNNGSDVLVIDKDAERINRMAESVTYAISADVCDIDTLRNAGIHNMDVVVVAMADSLEPSIMTIMTAKELGVKHIIAKARDEITGNIFYKVGADEVVYPEKESGIRMSHRLLTDGFLEYFELSDKVNLVEMLPKKEWIGKSLKELNLRKLYNVNVIALKKNNEITIAIDPDEPLDANTPLVITIRKSDMKRLTK